jgi:PAS domain-containing protein
MLSMGPRGPLDFLAGGGEMGARMRIRDWRLSPLGPPQNWPQSLKTAIRLMLSSGHPMFLWWGSRLIQFYNDAYSPSLGSERHPSALGQEGRICWDEIWHIIGPEIEHVMSGRGSTWHENAKISFTRNGRRESSYWTYSYSPIDDPLAATGVGGILAICAETTQAVKAAQQLKREHEQLAEMFEQAPSFMAMLRGPEHRFELANKAYMRLIGPRNVVGRTMAEVFPEVRDPSYMALLNQVYETGKAFTADAQQFLLREGTDGPLVEHYLDFVYQPIKDASGQVTGIFIDGINVTERTLAMRQQSSKDNPPQTSKQLEER